MSVTQSAAKRGSRRAVSKEKRKYLNCEFNGQRDGKVAQSGQMYVRLYTEACKSVRHQRGADAVRSAGRPLVLAPSWIVAYQDETLTLLSDHEVIVQNGIIEAVRPRRGTQDNRLELRGELLVPGFISAHSHLASGTATRGYVEGNLTPLSKVPKLRPGRQFLRAMELMEELSDAEMDDLTALNLAEVLRGGCTTLIEMSLSLRQMQSYVRMARRYGARGYPSAGVPEHKKNLAIWKRADDRILHESVAGTLREIGENLAYALAVDGADDGRIRPMMAAVSNVSHTPETFVAIRSAAEQVHGLHLHFQAGYGRPPQPDKESLQRLWGMDEVPWLHSLGVLAEGMNVIGAHLLGIDLERDLALLARPGFTFANCPSGTGAGVTPAQWPWPEALAAGVNTCIGLDTHSNDYLENLKLAVFYGRARCDFLGDRTSVSMVRPSIWTAMEAATVGGARGVGRTDIGRIEAGAKADICTIDVTGLLVGVGTNPIEPLNHLLYANGLSVKNVMTDGNWQVRGGSLLVDDEARLLERGGVVVRELWDQMAAEGIFGPIPTSDLIPVPRQESGE